MLKLNIYLFCGWTINCMETLFDFNLGSFFKFLLSKMTYNLSYSRIFLLFRDFITLWYLLSTHCHKVKFVDANRSNLLMQLGLETRNALSYDLLDFLALSRTFISWCKLSELMVGGVTNILELYSEALWPHQ